MDGVSGQDPFKWREPMQTTRRCPKCHSRLIIGPSEERCPYCAYIKHTALAPRERPSSGVDMWVRNQIQEAIGEAEDEYGRPADKFVDYEVPRENNFERHIFLIMFIILLMVLRIAFGRRRGIAAPEYVWYAIMLPSLLYIGVHYSTFLLPKLLAIVIGLGLAIVGLGVYLQPDLVPGLWISRVGPWAGYALLGYQVVAGLWTASLAWRDWRILRG